MYEQMRLKELELQKANIENDKIRMEKDYKRFCLEMARNNGNCTDAKSLVAEASIIYDFLK